MIVQIERQTTAQTINNNTITTATFTTIVYNEMNFTFGTAPYSEVTVNIEGTYIITANVGFDSGTTGYRAMFLQLNNPNINPPFGTWDTISSAYVGATIAGIKQLNCSAITRLNAGNKIRLRYFQTQGTGISTALSNSTNGTPNPTLSIALIVP